MKFIDCVAGLCLDECGKKKCDESCELAVVKGDESVQCCFCGRTLRAGSISAMEGFCIEGCDKDNLDY